jgi:hypothetical protein
VHRRSACIFNFNSQIYNAFGQVIVIKQGVRPGIFIPKLSVVGGKIAKFNGVEAQFWMFRQALFLADTETLDCACKEVKPKTKRLKSRTLRMRLIFMPKIGY